MELLILQFAKGKFTEAQAKHMLNGSFDLAWANICEKFKTDGTYYWNERLRVEKEKRQKFTESRRNNGSIEKINKKESKHMLKHMDKHMEDANENIINNKEIGIVAVREIANKVWADKAWMESLCMSNGLKMEGAKDWMSQFNLSISQDTVVGFDEKKYKKMFGGWLRMKLSGGQKIVKASDTAAKEKEFMKSLGL